MPESASKPHPYKAFNSHSEPRSSSSPFLNHTELAENPSKLSNIKRKLSFSRSPVNPVLLVHDETNKPQYHHQPTFHDPADQQQNVSPENRIKLAIDLRNNRQLEESTNQLRLACKDHDKTGFLLYGLALRQGSGVEKNYRESFKYIRMAAGISSEEDQVFKQETDPFQLYSIPQVPPEPLAPALYECGISYLKGYGVDRVDELKGLKYLEKAAALGHVDSICLSGTIWSKKSKVRRRDMARAAAWFRIADKRGANLIGAEWIYKDKYMQPSSKV